MNLSNKRGAPPLKDRAASKKKVSVCRAMLYLILLCFIPLSAVARDEESWRKYRDTVFVGTGTANDPYLITSAEELAGLAYGVNSNTLNTSDKYFKLTADINLGAHLWEPIGFSTGSSSHWFDGNFDGDGHTISNMGVDYGNRNNGKIDVSGSNSFRNRGLFGYLGASQNKTIKNFTLKNPLIHCGLQKTGYDNNNDSQASNLGAVVGLIESAGTTVTIQNVHVEGGDIRGVTLLGGLVGYSYAGTVNIISSSCSSIIDPHNSNGTGGNDAGGIIGGISGATESPGATVNMEETMFYGTILMADATNSFCGGIVGTLVKGKLNFNKNVVSRPVFKGLNGQLFKSLPNKFGMYGGYIHDCNSSLFGNRDCWAYDAGQTNMWKWGNCDKNGLNDSKYANGKGVVCWDERDVNSNVTGASPTNYYVSGGKLYLYKYTNPQPRNFKASIVNGNVKLTWDITAGNRLTPDSTYNIQAREVGLNRVWKDVEIVSDSSDLTYVKTETSKTVYVKFPGLHETATNYEFRIRRHSQTWHSEVSNYHAGATCTLPAYSFPKNPVVSANPNEGTITLSWSMSQQTDDKALKGDWIVEWTKNGTYGNLPALVSGSLMYNRTETSKTIVFPYPDMDKGNVTFKFRIRRADYPFSYAVLQTGNLTVNTNPVKLTSIDAEGSTSGINVKWMQDNGRMDKDWYFRLYRKLPANGSFNYTGGDFIKEIKASNLTRREIFDDLLAVSCEPYDYQVRLEAGADLATAVMKSASDVVSKADVVKLPSIQGEIEKLNVSKGFFNDRVDVKWKVTAGHTFTRFTISRVENDVPNAVPEIIEELLPSSTQTTDYRYADKTAVPGVYYTYEVTGWVDCNNTATAGYKTSTIGFIQPFGIINGKVTFEGGNAVAGVSVIAENDTDSQYANRAASFDASLGTSLEVPYKENMLSNKAFTWQAWVLVRSDASTGTIQSLLDAAGKYAIETDGDTIWFSVYQGNNADYEEYKFSDATITRGQYYHLTVAYAAEGNTGKATLYINGVPRQTVNKSITIHPFPTATAADSVIYMGRYWEGINYFNGFIDEVRLWKTTLDSVTIAGNYDCYLSGREMNLALYYRFDEPFSDQVFDMSGRNSVFNENHGALNNNTAGGIPPMRTSVYVPPCYNKAVTDNNGNYLINTIPYTGEGSSVIIKPMLGVHEFSPSNKPLFFNQQSSTYNNVDFTDISAFEVSGYIYYENSNYPVAGAMLKVDGMPVAKEGVAVQTNEAGYYSIKVPIGKHSISVELQGHQFVAGGRFPAYEEGLTEQRKHNFNDALSGINFYDKTKVTLVGRVVGGDIQREKQLGFGMSKANIGAATVTLKNDKTGVSFAQLETTATLGDGTSTKTYINKEGVLPTGTTITIETDTVTGEFIAVLPPIPFTVSGARTNDFGTLDPEDFSYNKRNFDINVNVQDTLEYVDNAGLITARVYANDSLCITRYNEPVLGVRDLNNPYGAFGDSIYLYQDNTMSTPDTIRLYNVTNGMVTYPFGYPIFSQKKAIYNWEVNAHELYVNPVTAEMDTVPLRYLNIQINNGLASYRAFLDEATGVYSQIESEQEGLLLDDMGKAIYTFQTGVPNLAGNHLLNLTMGIYRNGLTYEWKPGEDNFTAYLLGQVATNGSNFTTQGPDRVDFVLHDPPGSNSYAYIEKGASVTSTTTTADNYDKTWTHTATIHFNPEFESEAGTPFFSVVTKIQPIVDIAGIGVRGVVSEKGTFKTVTTTFDEMISTSSDPDFDGPMADVYIGKGTNMIYSQVRDLQFYPASQDNTHSTIGNNNYKLFSKEVWSVGEKFTTTFSYTQQHVLENVIPALKKLRNDLLTHIDGEYPVDSTTVPANMWPADGSPLYLTQKNASDPDFGEDDTYKVYIKPGATGENKKSKIADYRDWIVNWQLVIENNEKDKIELFDNRSTLSAKSEMSNRSLDAGAAIAVSTTVWVEDVTTSNYSNIYGDGTEDHFGILFNGAGLEYTVDYRNNETKSKGTEDGTENSITFGYELAESGKDVLSIDIYNPTTAKMLDLANKKNVSYLHGFTFQTRAGQTSCPYEGGDSTLFYKKDEKSVLLNYATFAIEKPEIYIDGNKNAVANNIPSGREATYTVQLQNLSEAGLPVTYQLSVADDSNPDGLILSIDGTPLTAPRNYTIEYGQELTKTLKVRQSSTDILDYEDIKLALSSTCDGAISKEATLEVHFIPSSTDSKLTAHNTLANINGGESASRDTTVTFTISEYDRNFRNFADLQLQYKPDNGTVWTMAKAWSYFKNGETLSDLSGDAISDASIVYRYSMKDRPDGRYNFRILSRTKLGNSYVTVPSNEVLVIKDVTAPKQFGAPLPSGGILAADGEVSVTFNEDIQSGVIMDDLTQFSNIEVKAEKNGAVIKHDAALKFTGNGPAATEAHIALSNTSFTLETFFQRNAGQAGTILAHGNDLSIGFNAANKLVVNISRQTFTSDQAFTEETWSYLVFTYNNESSVFSATILAAGNNALTFAGNPAMTVPAYLGAGKLYVGAKAEGKDAFTGNIHELSLWNEYTATNHMQGVKAGNERGLIGYWPLNEAHGLVGKDKARSRHLILPAANMWYSLINNYAALFTGNNSYATFDAAQLGIRADDDFVIELWFYGESQNNATLFSIGDGVLDLEPEKKLSIGFDGSGNLALRSNGLETQLSGKNYLDNTWHHFALNVLRNGSVIAYVDGEAVKQLSNASIDHVINDRITLGARNYNKPEGNGYVNVTDNYFTGSIDEVRVWRASLTADAIRRNIYNQLSGSENGLVAYYPFNRQGYNAQFPTVIETQSTLKNFAPLSGVRTETPVGSGQFVAKDSLVTLSSATLSQAQAPTLKPVRILEHVAHTFTANNNKIILNLTEAPSLIENTTLEISVKNILDLNGNASKDVRWTAYVNCNRLTWSENSVSINKKHLESALFTVSISNQSGQAENWKISNLPVWLDASETSGALQPLSSKVLSFTVSESTPVGSYEETVYLTGSQMIDVPLSVTLKVRSQKPDWSVNPSDFEESMNLIGQLKIGDKTSEDVEDIVAAFIGETCIGLASPLYDSRYDAYYVMMDIFGKTEYAGKEVIFQIWDAGTGMTYPVVTPSVAISFAPGRLYGSMNAPIVLTAENKVEQSVVLAKGWTWISLNTQVEDMSVAHVFRSVQDKTTLLKDMSVFAAPTGNGNWAGLLNTVATDRMYKINLNEASQFVLTGTPVDPQQTPIGIRKDWNWIGYTPQFSLPLKDALADLSPEEGDLIKGQSQFAVYTGEAWAGSLQTMAPGRGYLYQSLSGATKQFFYPSISSAIRLIRAGTNSRTPEIWTSVAETKYPGNMSVIAVVKDREEQVLDAEVAIFAEKECRGVQLTGEDDGYVFLSVAGDDNPVTLKLKVYNRETGMIKEIKKTISFAMDAILGTVSAPYVIQLNDFVGMEETIPTDIRVYPTKVQDVLFVESSANDLEAIIFHDLSGRALRRIDHLNDRTQVNVSDLPRGIYMVTVEKKNGERIVVRIVK